MSEPTLRVRDLRARYSKLEVIHGIDLDAQRGEVVVVLGPNGAGKTSLLRALAQLITNSGSIELEGHEVPRAQPHRCVQRGMALVPQGRGTIVDLSVEENLRVGGSSRTRAEVEAGLDRWFHVFPRLAERRQQTAGSLSGGEQQMLAIARAMMSHPRLLLLDEPSLGLAPLVVRSVFETLADLNKTDNLTMVVVEQNASTALELAHRAYILESGRLSEVDHVSRIRTDAALRRAYLGY